MRPLLRQELLKSLQLVDEAGALEIFKIAGKDPRRTFRRLANKYKLEYVRIDGFKWFTIRGIRELIEKHTVNGAKKTPTAQRPTLNVQLQERAAA